MEENKGDLPLKDQVIETIIDIFIRVTGFIEREEVSRTTNPAKDFYIDTDDLSIYIEELEKHFGIKSPPGDWPIGFEPTFEGVADYVLFHLSKKQ
jgi:acyl carrier protein